MPWINHSWHVPLYVTARGRTTSPIPYDVRTFEIEFDFINHRLLIRVSDGTERALPLIPLSVADFHDEILGALEGLGLRVAIHGRPNELADAIRLPFGPNLCFKLGNGPQHVEE
jgi:hypothetical protein